MITKSHIATLFFVVLCSNAQAQNHPYDYGGPTRCDLSENLDSWVLEPSKEIPGEYDFTYVNNLAECSDTIQGRAVEAEDGFRIMLYVKVGANDSEDELIYVIPEDALYQPWPIEIIAPDSSEPYKIRLIPGIS